MTDQQLKDKIVDASIQGTARALLWVEQAPLNENDKDIALKMSGMIYEYACKLMKQNAKSVDSFWVLYDAMQSSAEIAFALCESCEQSNRLSKGETNG